MWPNKDARDLRLMWTFNPPMHFSVHIMAHTLQKQLVWPWANFVFLVSGNKCLSVNLARDSTTPTDKTRTRSCLQQSFPLTWLQFPKWTTGTFSATILLAYGLIQLLLRSREYAFSVYNGAVGPYGKKNISAELNTTAYKKYYTWL